MKTKSALVYVANMFSDGSHVSYRYNPSTKIEVDRSKQLTQDHLARDGVIFLSKNKEFIAKVLKSFAVVENLK